MRYIQAVVIVTAWVTFIGCIVAGAGTSDVASSSSLSQKYYDGCYYIVTEQGGITPKVNQPSSCKE